MSSKLHCPEGSGEIIGQSITIRDNWEQSRDQHTFQRTVLFQGNKRAWWIRWPFRDADHINFSSGGSFSSAIKNLTYWPQFSNRVYGTKTVFKITGIKIAYFFRHNPPYTTEISDILLLHSDSWMIQKQSLDFPQLCT